MIDDFKNVTIRSTLSKKDQQHYDDLIEERSNLNDLEVRVLRKLEKKYGVRFRTTNGGQFEVFDSPEFENKYGHLYNINRDKYVELMNKIRKEFEEQYEIERQKELGYSQEVDLVAEALIATRDPEYVELGYYLNNIYNQGKRVDYQEVKKADLLESEIKETYPSSKLSSDKGKHHIMGHPPANIWYMEGDVKTTYQEFQQIEKQKVKLDKERCKMINRYSEVRGFLEDGSRYGSTPYSSVLNKITDFLKEKGIDINSYDPRMDNTITPKEWTEFFDSCPEMGFAKSSEMSMGHIK